MKSIEKRIRFTSHAQNKLKRLAKIGVTREKLEAMIKIPERVMNGHHGRKIAEGSLTDELMLRAVYEENEREILIITLYPSKRGRYE